MRNRFGRALAALLAMALLLATLPGATTAQATDAAETEAEALPLVFTLPAQPEGAVVADAASVTDLSERLTDGNANTRVPCALGETIRADWPDAGQAAGTLYLEWHAAPADGYTLVQYGAAGEELSRELVRDGILNRTFALEAGCSGVELLVGDGLIPQEETESQRKERLSEDRMALSGLTVYGEGVLPATVQQWTTGDPEPDVLLVVAQPGEEFTVFGGLLPVLLDHGADVRVLFMTETTAQARNESFAALYALGLRVQPLIAGFIGRGGTDYEILQSKKEWGANGSPHLVLQAHLAALQPAVVISYASDAAQENGMHRLTGETVAKALSALAQEKDAPWQPAKYYVLAADDADDGAALTVPDGAAQLVSYGGRSGDELAQAALDTWFASLVVLRPQAAAGCAYRLVSSTVGADTGSDLLEHVDVPPVPTATPEPTPEPTATPTATPSPTPETAVPEEPAAAAAIPAITGERLLLAGILLLAGLAGTFALLLARSRQRSEADRKKRRRRAMPLALCFLPLALALILAAGVWFLLPADADAQAAADAREEEAVTPTPSAADMAEPAPTPSDTPAPTETPVATPEATADPWAEYFRSEDDPEEVVVIDAENGVWEYRTDTLSILIERRFTEKPMTYFVAHIRMRDVDSFRPVFSNAANTGGGPKQMPWKVARMNRAVLLITGDNIIYDEKERKGILIRNGWTYHEGQASDTMALYPDMSMRVFDRKTVTAQELLEAGVLNSYGFMYDPILVRDGVIETSTAKSAIKGNNPRTALGMVEPGHFVAIVVDGRQTKVKVNGETVPYSAGATMTELAQLMIDEGCSVAYNLDGGISACMVFMGEQINVHLGVGLSYQRTIPEAIAWGYSELVPSVDDQVSGTGERK